MKDLFLISVACLLCIATIIGIRRELFPDAIKPHVSVITEGHSTLAVNPSMYCDADLTTTFTAALDTSQAVDKTLRCVHCGRSFGRHRTGAEWFSYLHPYN